MIRFYNTLTRSLEDFVPLEEGKVGLYCCGPTVYNYAHIGNLRTYIFEDLLHRTLVHAGYKLKHVMNITDVGHLTGDGDDGEDKMAKSAREAGRSVWDIAAFYTEAFFHDEALLNIIRPDVVCKATDNIDGMIEVIKLLEEKGHTYTAGGNVYFSIDTIDDYGKLAKLNLDELKEGARIEVDGNKRNPKDFVLWFTNSKFQGQAMQWPSPWGTGYPGWHIECSAMSSRYLGHQFDIHCGGIDAIPVHHTNEIAQSEAAFGIKPWVRYWLHGEFLLNDKGKMSKSSGGFLTLTSLTDQGYDPLDYRYFCLTGHYRSQLRFSFDSLSQARQARLTLMRRVAALKAATKAADALSGRAAELEKAFFDAMEDDLKAPQALAVLWTALRDESVDDAQKLALVLSMDSILGLSLDKAGDEATTADDVPQEALDLVAQRTAAKKAKDFKRADEIRDQLTAMGFKVVDPPKGPVLERCNLGN